jgi:predicted SAM-dependent methyltransferase
MIKVNIGCGHRFHKDWINLDALPVDPTVRRFACGEPLPFDSDSVDFVYSSHMIEHLRPQAGLEFLSECRRVLKPGGWIRLVTPDFENFLIEYLDNLNKGLAGDQQAIARYEWLGIEIFDQFSRERSGGMMLEYWTNDPMPCEEYVLSRMGSECADFVSRYRREPAFAEAVRRNLEVSTTSSPERVAEIEFERHRWLYDRLSIGNALRKAGFVDVRSRTAVESAMTEFRSFALDADLEGRVRKPDSLFMEAKKRENI